MIKKLLITALVIINLQYGSALVTMSPQLAKIVPKDLPPLPEENIICFNKFWEIKASLDKQLRQRWNCTDGCAKGPECCISYKVLDDLKHLIGLHPIGPTLYGQYCTHGALSMVRMFLPMAMNRIKEKCEPEYEHESTLCTAMEELLPPLPKESRLKQ